jgi:hypothetical protein
MVSSFLFCAIFHPPSSARPSSVAYYSGTARREYRTKTVTLSFSSRDRRAIKCCRSTANAGLYNNMYGLLLRGRWKGGLTAIGVAGDWKISTRECSAYNWQSPPIRRPKDVVAGADSICPAVLSTLSPWHAPSFSKEDRSIHPNFCFRLYTTARELRLAQPFEIDDMSCTRRARSPCLANIAVQDHRPIIQSFYDWAGDNERHSARP